MVLIVIGLLVLPGFPSKAGNTAKPPEKNRMQPGHAPTPYSADEIRKGCPAGRTTKFMIEMIGQPTSYQLLTFVAHSTEGTGFESIELDWEGNQVGEKQTAQAGWEELQSHASFPEANTRISSESYMTPAGKFDCWLYVVTTEKEGKKEEARYWFAKSLPGAPIYVEQAIDGNTVFKMTLVENRK